MRPQTVQIIYIFTIWKTVQIQTWISDLQFCAKACRNQKYFSLRKRPKEKTSAKALQKRASNLKNFVFYLENDSRMILWTHNWAGNNISPQLYVLLFHWEHFPLLDSSENFNHNGCLPPLTLWGWQLHLKQFLQSIYFTLLDTTQYFLRKGICCWNPLGTRFIQTITSLHFVVFFH